MATEWVDLPELRCRSVEKRFLYLRGESAEQVVQRVWGYLDFDDFFMTREALIKLVQKALEQHEEYRRERRERLEMEGIQKDEEDMRYQRLRNKRDSNVLVMRRTELKDGV